MLLSLTKSDSIHQKKYDYPLITSMHSSDTCNIVIACKRISESKSVSKEALGIYDLEQVPHIVTEKGASSGI